MMIADDDNDDDIMDSDNNECRHSKLITVDQNVGSTHPQQQAQLLKPSLRQNTEIRVSVADMTCHMLQCFCLPII